MGFVIEALVNHPTAPFSQKREQLGIGLLTTWKLGHPPRHMAHPNRVLSSEMLAANVSQKRTGWGLILATSPRARILSANPLTPTTHNGLRCVPIENV